MWGMLNNDFKFLVVFVDNLISCLFFVVVCVHIFCLLVVGGRRSVVRRNPLMVYED